MESNLPFLSFLVYQWSQAVQPITVTVTDGTLAEVSTDLSRFTVAWV